MDIVYKSYNFCLLLKKKYLNKTMEILNFGRI